MAPRVNNFKLGTEYNISKSDGVNTILGEYSVTFTDKKATIETLESTLASLNGTAVFKWNPYINFLPSSVAKAFICEEWKTNYDDVDKSILTATFKEQPIL